MTAEAHGFHLQLHLELSVKFSKILADWSVQRNPLSASISSCLLEPTVVRKKRARGCENTKFRGHKKCFVKVIIEQFLRNDRHDVA